MRSIACTSLCTCCWKPCTWLYSRRMCLISYGTNQSPSVAVVPLSPFHPSSSPLLSPPPPTLPHFLLSTLTASLSSTCPATSLLPFVVLVRLSSSSASPSMTDGKQVLFSHCGSFLPTLSFGCRSKTARVSRGLVCWWAVHVNTTLYLKIPLGLCSSKK